VVSRSSPAALGKLFPLDAIAVLTGRIPSTVTPGKLDVLFLESDDNVIAIGQGAVGKAVFAEEAVFGLESVQVDYIADSHFSSFS